MAYILNMAKVVTHEFAKFTGYRRHQLIGHVVNLDFWITEVRHCLEMLDDYGWRFEQAHAAQTKYIFEHKAIEFEMDEPGRIKGPAVPSKRVPDAEVKKARAALCDAFYGFLVRCHNKDFLDEARLRKECALLGIEVAADDLKSRKV